MSKILVPWSGGLDSTYLITHLLAEGHTIDAYYVNINTTSEQSKREQKAIKNMLPYLEQFSFEYKGVSVDIDVNIEGNQILSYQFLWPILLMAGEYDNIAIGYVMNDDAISWLNELKTLLESYRPFVYVFPELLTPLTKMRKQEIWNSLNDGLKKHVTWCENKDKILTSCGQCSSCKRMKGIGDE